METTLRRTALVLAAVASASLVQTDRAAAQVAGQEVYQLAQVNGQDLPFAEQDDDGCRDELHSATLTLEPNGEWLLVTHERETCGNETSEEEDREDGRYAVEGEAIRFLDDDGEQIEDDADDDGIEVDHLREGTRTEAGLTVRLADGETELQFRR